jgi:hypothetical protein
LERDEHQLEKNIRQGKYAIEVEALDVAAAEQEKKQEL